MKHPHSAKRHHRLVTNDTLVSGEMLDHAVDAITKRIKLDCDHDVPYLAGYSRDGRTIYIDRHLPRTFVTRGRRVAVDRFLILHEAVEKSLLDELGLCYQHAHQIALRAEEAAVRADGVGWREYDRFMQQFIKEAGDETLTRLPLDLDIKPYRDEHDRKLLLLMQQAMELERQQLALPPAAVARAAGAAKANGAKRPRGVRSGASRRRAKS